MRAGVTIDRFYLQGDTTHRQQLLESLENQAWPAQDDVRCFIIRKIEVSGHWWSLAEKSVQLAHEAQLTAVCGWQAAAARADVIRFDSTAAMVACLLHDINSGKHYWYWQSRPETGLPQADAMSRVLSEYVTLLPEIMAQLEARQIPPLFLMHLDESRLDRLMAAITVTTGWNLTVEPAEKSQPARFVQPSETVEIEQSKILFSLAQWQPLLEKTHERQKQPLERLAAVITAWRFLPQALADQPRRVEWYRKVQAVLNQSNKGINRKREMLIMANDEIENHPANHNTDALTQPPSPVSALSPEKAQIAPEEYPYIPAQSGSDSFEQISSPPEVAYDNDKRAPQVAIHYSEFMTHSGGLFYLLNLLKVSTVVTWIESSEHSPWFWLYRLSLLAGHRPDDALANFIAEQLLLDGRAELAALSPIPQEVALYELLCRRLEKEPFWPAGMFGFPALVRLDSALLDIYFHTASINIDLRMVGLDLNPGWLPWVGRVVTFHYGEDERLLLANEAGCDTA